MERISSPERSFILPSYAEQAAQTLALAPSPFPLEKTPSLESRAVERYLDIYASEEHVPFLDTVEDDRRA